MGNLTYAFPTASSSTYGGIKLSSTGPFSLDVMGNLTYASPTASSSTSGIITTDAQTIAGAKTFSNDIIVNGTTTSASFITSSDFRLKKNIVPLQHSLDALMQLNPVSYDKKKSLESSDYSVKENGFIAQEIKKVFPTLVIEGTDKDKLLSVNYIALIPVLTKAIQEQQQEIKELKELVEQLINKK